MQRRKAVFCAVRNFRVCVVTLKLGLNSGVRNIEFTRRGFVPTIEPTSYKTSETHHGNPHTASADI